LGLNYFLTKEHKKETISQTEKDSKEKRKKEKTQGSETNMLREPKRPFNARELQIQTRYL